MNRFGLVGWVMAVVVVGCPWLGARGDVSIRNEQIEVRFVGDAAAFEVLDREAGPVAQVGSLTVRAGDRSIEVKPGAEARAQGNDVIVVTLAADRTIEARIAGPRVQWTQKGPEEAKLDLQVRPLMGNDARVAILEDQRAADRNVLQMVLGSAKVPGANAYYDPDRDLAIALLPANQVKGSSPNGLVVHRHYYRDTLKIAYYAPMPRQKRWPTAPVVAMTWYGIEGWKDQPGQKKEWLYPQIDWVAQHLKPYAGDNLVFQFDDNYLYKDDRYMRDLSDYVRSKGLVPGIWFTPYMVAPPSEYDAHPEWFIHGPDGKPIGTFGGMNWGRSGAPGQRNGCTLNVTNAEAVEKWFGMFWHKASEAWNFDFFKIDGQPDVINAYKKAKDGGGVEGYRKGLAIGRKIVGPDKFINGCWGIPLEAIGPLNGSRTGGDTGLDPHAINMIIQWNFLNNTAWWCDPDAAANLYKATVERTRLNAQARVLTGQQFLTDDDWVKVPADVRRVWQLSFPMLDIRPVNLYKIDDWRKYDIFDLRIQKPWGSWDVVGLFNYSAQAVNKDLDLARLALDAEKVHVFEYWSNTYLGEFPRDQKISRSMAAYEGQAFSVVPAIAEGRPALISTSRHVSQGGLDLVDVKRQASGGSIVFTGRSAHLVAGDPYVLSFASGRFDVERGETSNGQMKWERQGGVSRVQITPANNGEANWTVRFSPIRGGRVEIVPGSVDVRPGEAAKIEVRNIGDAAAPFVLAGSDARVQVEPRSGTVEAGSSQAAQIRVDPQGLEPGSSWTGNIALRSADAAAQPAQVRFRVPTPHNLALDAKAAASSQWSGAHAARMINDGDESTRWNSRAGQRDGSWVELTWEQPVDFDRIVIDESTDWGNRIQAWHIEADGAAAPIAKGEQVGRNHVVKLDRPTKAKRLRLVIDKASETPTIWEVQVFQWDKAR